jgi:hypothetical protein
MSVVFMSLELCYFEFWVLIDEIDPTSTSSISTGMHFRTGTHELSLLHSSSPTTFSIYFWSIGEKKIFAFRSSVFSNNVFNSRINLTYQEFIMLPAMNRNDHGVQVDTCLKSSIPVHVLNDGLNLCALSRANLLVFVNVDKCGIVLSWHEKNLLK